MRRRSQSMCAVTGTLPQRRARVPRLSAVMPAVSRPTVRVGSLVIDFESRTVQRKGRPVHLSRLEFDLLTTLLSPAGALNTRAELIERLWSGRKISDTRTLDTHMRRLRIKLEEDPTKPRHLVTVRGVGFRLDP